MNPADRDRLTILAHELSSLQGKVAKTTEECLDLLRTGLQAVNRSPDKLPVLVERVEVVLEILTKLSKEAQNPKEN